MRQERIEDFKQAAEYLKAVSGSGIVLGLETMKMLCAKLGNPQDDLRFIHIAGTNGKGSVLCFISTILKCAGYRVGRYVSPAVFTELEKFQIGERNISKTDYVQTLEAVRQAAEAMEKEGRPYPTVFEIETAMAFVYFRQKGCDVIVLETGMGGLLDATNVIKTTVAAVLTSISMDHVGILGNSFEEIAAQKAGIIKKGCKVISLMQKPEAMRVIEESARLQNAELVLADNSKVTKVHHSLKKQRFNYKTYEKLEIGMPADYQIQNAVLSLEAVKAVEETFPVTERMLRKGLLSADWKGRFTILAQKPYFIIDGAHNMDAAQKLRECISIYFTNKKIITIIGILRDKDYEKIVEQTAPLTTAVITVTTPDNKRAMPAIELAEVVRKYQPNVTAADSLQEAVEMSCLLAGKEDVILAFGSLSYLGEIAAIVANRDKIRRDTHGKSRKD